MMLTADHDEHALRRASLALEPTPETELASRVLQGLCAVYLLLQASKSAPMDEIDAALKRVGEWASELADAVQSPQCLSAPQLAPVSTALGRALGELRKFAYPTTYGEPAAHGAAAAEYLKFAEHRIQHARGTTDIRALFASGCCAADIKNISEKRNR